VVGAVRDDPETEETMSEQKNPTREDIINLAREFALSERQRSTPATPCHSYLPRHGDVSWQPHGWVIEAITAAARQFDGWAIGVLTDAISRLMRELAEMKSQRDAALSQRDAAASAHNKVSERLAKAEQDAEKLNAEIAAAQRAYEKSGDAVARRSCVIDAAITWRNRSHPQAESILVKAVDELGYGFESTKRGGG
jgi:hypothetical protein